MGTIGLPSRIYRIEVTDETLVTIPSALSQELGLQAGDRVEILVNNEQAILRPAQQPGGSSLRRLLSDYFASREDVQSFLDEERSGWSNDDDSSQR